MQIRTILAGFAVAALTFSLASRRADARAFIATPGAQSQPANHFTGFVGLSSIYDLELGGKYAWKIADPGFVPVINNSVFIEGSSFVTTTGHIFVAPLLLWCFHLHPMWSVYAEAGAELGFSFKSRTNDRYDDYYGGSPTRAGLSATGGAFWRYSSNMWMRFEIDLRHSSGRVGLTWPL